jgi:hypothetical protein
MVDDESNAKAGLLDPRFDLWNHSMTGFNWGYAGSGPAQLALALLADATGDDDFAVEHHQAYKFDRLVELDRTEWEMTQSDILDWAVGRGFQVSDDEG